MNENSYEKQLYNIIKHSGGSILGFNKLIGKRGKGKKFHTTTALKALKKLEEHGDIRIEDTHERNKKRYVDNRPTLDAAWEKITGGKLKEIANQLKNPDLIIQERIFLISNYIQYAFYMHDNFRLLLLSPKIFESDAPTIIRTKKLREKLMGDIQNMLDSLTEFERFYVTKNLIKKEPEFLSIKEYREWTHKPTRKEKLEEQRKLEKQSQQSYVESLKEEPYCRVCGKKKPKLMKAYDKHLDSHLNEIPNILSGMFQGLYCPVCAKRHIGTTEQAIKHEEAHKKTKK